MTAKRHNTGVCNPDCFGCKAAGVSFSSSAMPTRSNVRNTEVETAVMHKDVAAYKRLRKDGLQPKSVKGSAALEARADSRWEVETGQRIGDVKIGKRLDEVQGAINKGESPL